jgi:hypothetical protein
MVFFAGCASSRPGNTPCTGAHCDGGAGGIDLSASMDDASAIDFGAPDLTPLKMFGDPCTDRSQCQSGICIFSGLGGVCSVMCPNIGCPAGYGCYGVLGGGIDPGEVVQLCVPENNLLCSPCSKSTECGSPLGKDLCLPYPTGTFCGRDCTNISCPPTYTCQTSTGDGGVIKQCVPNNNSCDCTPASVGRTTVCTITTPTGTSCNGARTCNGAQGWSACAPPSATDLPDDAFTDSNCDGVDGDVAHALFVDTLTGNDNSAGTMTKPLVTIAKAIALASASGGAITQILVSKGTYPPLVLNGASGSPHIYGGYDAANNWQRAAGNAVIIAGANPSVDISGASSEIRLDLITVLSNAASGGPGRSSYGVRVIGSAGPVLLHWCNITAGNGTGGQSGSAGTKGANGGAGGNGVNGCECSQTSTGGSAGGSSCNVGGGGGAGVGGSGNAYSGSAGQGPAQGGGGSAGCGCSKSCIGTCSCGGRCAPASGGTGGSGSTGASGGAAAAIGLTNGTDYVPADGFSGNNGTDGSGGGGGGGGGGSDSGCYCNTYSGGGGGGGGGAGCHGNAGGMGTGGGGSFALFSLGSMVTIDKSTLVAGNGGNGGNGEPGGLGGSYGAGGAGGAPSADGEQGGAGGPGGSGGAGGNGSGGSGGPSVGIFSVGGTISQPGGSNTFQPGNGGQGGAGGVNNVASPASGGQAGTSTGVIIK